jgi:hypothetical protein
MTQSVCNGYWLDDPGLISGRGRDVPVRYHVQTIHPASPIQLVSTDFSWGKAYRRMKLMAHLDILPR